MTKLTLSVDERAIENGKAYAHRQGRTLSSIVESYLYSLAAPTGERETLPPSVRALMGIGRGPTDESDYRRHLMEKH
ncbi:DUF6364 family protein [Bifidobacterium biavatii]|uniref:Toxin-antitoxin system protein n=1 Tax=Bifidobacterium biavatii DSM 23969 TaxID=1437608 RepID=A0A086ZW01_9BIFI|nr:DUF6364 family protein [Bifidobacterium biavatii]KFI50701.1 toxin-antitoxin system protein [Bifidobacterium biavatii DSM 23969]